MSPTATRVLLTVITVLLICSPRALADPILEIHDASLTTYVPSSTSNIQDIRALPMQRGQRIDGTPVPAPLQGPPQDDEFHSPRTCGESGLRPGEGDMGQITPGTATPIIPLGDGGTAATGPTRGDIGVVPVRDVDLRFPADVAWIISRSHNSRQKNSGGSYFASAGYQGNNWFQDSQPELVFHDSQTDSEDMIYLIYRADQFIEFRRGDDQSTGDSTDTFKAVNGAAGAILLHTFDGIDLATYYNPLGKRFDFFWFGDADIDDDIEGSIWRIMDPTVEGDPYDAGDPLTSTDGNIAYIGDIGDPHTALSSGFDTSSGAVTTAYDSAGRRFTYTYTSGMLTQVKAEINDSGWQEVGKVDYTYYVDADAHGEDDDLELVTVTMPLTDSGVSIATKTYYWYYEGTYNATTNAGYPGQIQYVISPEGYRNYDWAQDSSLDDDPLSAAENDLKAYASAYFEYDTERRVVSFWTNGACGCSGATSGAHTVEYEANGSYSDGTGYDTVWASRTIVQRPNVTYETSAGTTESWTTEYFDETGQSVHVVHSDDDPDTASNFWVTNVTRNSDGQITAIHSPANVSGYTHSTAAITTSTSEGLVTLFTRTSSGDLEGFIEDQKHQEGTSGDAYLDLTRTWTSRTLSAGDAGVVRPLVASRRVYPDAITSGTSGSNLTSYSYAYHSGTSTTVLYLALKQITTTHPAVTTANNGSNSSNTREQYIRKDGTTAFVEAEDGIFTYTQFADGQMIKRIDDAKTNAAYPTGDDPNTDFGITEAGDGVARSTVVDFDDQGRRDSVTRPDGRVFKSYYSKLADGRLVSLSYNDYETSPSTKFFGPVQYTVFNHAGSPEVRATVALSNNVSTTALTGHIDEVDGDPITAMDLGTVARLSTTVYDETGTIRQETRLYHNVPASGAGSDGTNYDPTTYGYDDQGRLVRTEAPHGTISRTGFDTLGRVEHQWIGTNDNDFDGGDTSGTDDMVKTLANQYDAGGEGNGYLTNRTVYVQDSDTDKRQTTFSVDVRGRVVLVKNPTAPHVFNAYDNIGRLTASGQYSSYASIVVGTDDPVSESTNRLTLNQISFDELGRVWRTQRHEIDMSDGSDDDNLESQTWFDATGRTIKQHGAQLTKTLYDRLGRRTHVFTLANDNDTGYSDADDVSGDVVLVESETVYESTDSDDVVLRVVTSRFHDDYKSGYTTGALNTNADGDDLLVTAANLEGRPQITASWYDRFGRATDTVRYGTNRGNNLDRDGLSVPARSDDELVTEYVYNTDGSRQSVTDPMNLETRFEYDDTGRQTAVVANYVNGTPSGVTGDDDVYTRYVYTDGLKTKEWADIDGDDVEGAGDQVTEYTYGITKGVSAGDSKIGTGHLLYEVKYPDSASASDIVQYAYNAQGQQIYMIDQAGNVIETDYDDSGRSEHRRATTITSGFDGAVKRISTTYDDLGRRELVTQYDNAAVGSGSVVDEVKFTYSDWGDVAKFEQDHNSAVGAAGSVDDYEISYAFGTGPSGGWQVVRRTRMYMPDSSYLSYSYASTEGGDDFFDNDVSRVTKVSIGVTEAARYWYNAVGQLVGSVNADADAMWERFSSTSGDYPDLDAFNRVTSSRWTKDLATDRDFYDVDITYDRNSNIVLIEDNVHGSHDVDFTIDDLSRLTQSEQGTWNGSTITGKSQDQIWTLDQLGNWDVVQFDINGDGDFTDTDEYDDDRTHNDVNELTGRDTDDNGTDDYTLTYDAVGNLTDDGEHYEYVYDVFGRLRKIENQSSTVIAEYTYNGLGHRITMLNDTDTDGDADANDTLFRLVYDEGWRVVATYREDDDEPKEQFVNHNAGARGFGGSSYIDDVIARDKDANTAWTSASDGTLEERVYYFQNWRHDVSAVLSSSGRMEEWVAWTSYGVPKGRPKGDAESDGDVDVGNTADTDQIQTWIDAPAYDVRGDLDLDGDVDSTDKSAASANAGASLDLWELSDLGNRKGYAGYESDPYLSTAAYCVRNRVYGADLGQWLQRDPVGYADGLNLRSYVNGRTLQAADPYGLATWNPYADECDCVQLKDEGPDPPAKMHFPVPPNGDFQPPWNPFPPPSDFGGLWEGCNTICGDMPNVLGLTLCDGGFFPSHMCICLDRVVSRIGYLYPQGGDQPDSCQKNAFLNCVMEHERIHRDEPCCEVLHNPFDCIECNAWEEHVNCIEDAMNQCQANGSTTDPTAFKDWTQGNRDHHCANCDGVGGPNPVFETGPNP